MQNGFGRPFQNGNGSNGSNGFGGGGSDSRMSEPRNVSDARAAFDSLFKKP
ncbi:MAG TPA: hypothetical protein VGL53_04225 [Bryobacteraceae bacterium]